MRAKTALFRIVEKSLPQDMHARRRKTLVTAVAAAVSGESVTLTGIGRALSTVGGRSSPKHDIKKVDRLLGNPLLHVEMTDVYGSLARRFLEGLSRPVILVDWTELDRDRTHALVASLAIEGRSQIIHAKLVGKQQSASPVVHYDFLEELSLVLPQGCRPIIVTDAGFQTSWCENVLALGWDYVTRVRGRTKYSDSRRRSWRSAKSLYTEAKTKAFDVGKVLLTAQHAREVRLVMSPKPRQKKASGHARATNDLKHAKAQTEPWLLATSLNDTAANVVKLYSKRMQIEETFRDAKSSRFGFSLEHARGRPERIAVLLLIAAFATMALLVVGMSGERTNVQRHFQANTVRSKRVLSLVRLGFEMWRYDRKIFMPQTINFAAWVPS